MYTGNFGVADYLFFATSIGFAVLVGIYHAVKDLNNYSLANYYYANRLISPYAIGVSMAVTFISSLTVIGVPEMAYSNGTVVFWMSVASLVQLIPAYFYFIPFLHQLKLASVYEYLEMRFHVSIRRLTSFFQIINQTLYMAIGVYLTALALAVVSPVPFGVSVVVTCVVCTFYTVMGGMKAVIWVDFVQAFIMAAGCVAVLIKTTIDVGGLNEIYQSLERGRRNNFLTFNPDPTFTLSAWTMIFGLGLNWSSVPCCSQSIVQRLQSCKSVKDAKLALVAFATLLFYLLFNAAANGCVMWTYFEKCDPLKSGDIEDKNQYIPFLVVNIFRDVPGMAGVFVSAAYSGMLSTVSSGMNALSNLIIEDFVRPFCSSTVSDRSYLIMGKATGAILGVVIAAGTFMIKSIGTSIITFAFSIDGILGGPIFGLFLAGLFIPWISNKGAASGFVCAIATTMWISVGHKWYGSSPTSSFNLTQPTCPTLPSNLTLLTTINATTMPYTIDGNLTFPHTESTTDAIVDDYERPLIADTVYSISYMYYGTIGTVLCIIYTSIASLILGCDDPKKMNPLLFMPLCESDLLSDRMRRAFRFGVPPITDHHHHSHHQKTKSASDENAGETERMISKV